jgi:hypothetical protein
MAAMGYLVAPARRDGHGPLDGAVAAEIGIGMA